MCSRGSIIPLFIDQIINGKDLTITNPNMTIYDVIRGFSQFGIYAFQNTNPGDIFVQKSPQQQSNLSNSLLHYLIDNKIKIISARHGEKMFESYVEKRKCQRLMTLNNMRYLQI